MSLCSQAALQKAKRRKKIKNKKERNKILSQYWHCTKSGLGTSHCWGFNHHMEQGLAKNVFLSPETLPSWDFGTHIYEQHYTLGRKKKKDEAEKASAQLVPHQWRELVEGTWKSSPQNQNKTPLFWNGQLYTGRSNHPMARHDYTISYNREEANRSKSKFREYYYSASSLEIHNKY